MFEKGSRLTRDDEAAISWLRFDLPFLRFEDGAKVTQRYHRCGDHNGAEHLLNECRSLHTARSILGLRGVEDLQRRPELALAFVELVSSPHAGG